MAVEKSTRDDSPDHTLPAGEGPQGGGLSSPCMAHQTQLHRVEWLHSLAIESHVFGAVKQQTHTKNDGEMFGNGETTGCKVWTFTPFQDHFKCLEMFDDGHDGHDGLQLMS